MAHQECRELLDVSTILAGGECEWNKAAESPALQVEHLNAQGGLVPACNWHGQASLYQPVQQLDSSKDEQQNSIMLLCTWGPS